MGDGKVSGDIIARLAEVRDSSGMSAIFDDIREAYGVDHIVYHAVNVRGLTRDGAFLRLTYSDEWISQYYQEDYFNTDPVVEEGARAFMPFEWTKLDWSTKKRQEFREDSVDHSVGNVGFTVPIRGPDGQHAMFTVTAARSEKSWIRQMGEQTFELHNIAHHLHQATIRVEGAEPPVEITALSIRERDVLQLAATGRTNDEIADKLAIAERTVRVYLETARYKLAAANRTHAVARALSLGLIHPPD